MTSVCYNIDPELRWDREAKNWVVLREFHVYWQRNEKPAWTFTVPAGFRTDLASIPKVLRSIISQVGPNIQAAITHDWCYNNEVIWRGTDMTKAEADQLFQDGMSSLGVHWFKKSLMYLGVRVFGRSSFR